ncbi:hypothetical protein COY45_00040 [Candidatus Berkelbacteria bacterium CG_4_10_14_0_8_um_filter_42_34]|uniref:Uncharacterized protein n=2 Tax=Candidatus Berkelbacteria TaxID=1618330 RepID=A0A2M7K1J3_9BACT|nr:MAG: hypothetical protein COZ63_01510 [Candidatus Berkelbacteria bacterium CG_4_8_14_3_um_filter_42_13]PIZ27887.1 MAG: hypothetical protein COY45_00040 [Candidatus Berkelbacteria bacterium CG_4_10_14_0_8_um_filter_42_34]
MKQVKKITIAELKKMAKRMFGNLVKGVIDVEKEILVIDAEMHADEEKFLLENGLKQKNLWGINLYPEKFGSDDFVEFDSMINLRLSQNNRSRGVDNEKIRAKIIKIVNSKIEK